MFERRLKIVLFAVFLLMGTLLVRAMVVQIVEQREWSKAASSALQERKLVETTRGRILDVVGRELAVDKDCTDACVAYQAIADEPDPNDLEAVKRHKDWLKDTATQQLKKRLGKDFSDAGKTRRKSMLDEEVNRIRSDIKQMWVELAKVSNKTPEEIDEIRHEIMFAVETRKRAVWFNRWQKVAKDQPDEPTPWLKRWLLGESDEGPGIDRFAVTVKEETEPQVILGNISNDVANYLGKNIDRFPGLVLKSGIVRYYPFGDAAAHVIGSLRHVSAEDLKTDPNLLDDRRRYYRNDLIGRNGVESLAESLLRGTRGRITSLSGQDRPVETVSPSPGQDVHLTIDIELQKEVQACFKDVIVSGPPPGHEEINVGEMLGAAVVMEVDSGKILAMVSNPTFDLNTLDTQYSKLVRDDMRRPLLNRATQMAAEPGSTVKPMVGMAAITEKLCTPEDPIECTGYLILHKHKYADGKCWTMKFLPLDPQHPERFIHHKIPEGAEHPTGFLTFADALERSCNIYFENRADQLGLERISNWFSRFGLGKKTGVGIEEWKGKVPMDAKGPQRAMLSTTWFAGIGQGQVLATPVQMVDVAATIARDGKWMRPTILKDQAKLIPTTQPEPDEVQLHIAPEALAAAKEGMIRVVQGAAGSGTAARTPGVLVAGKTGTAQAPKFRIPVRDSNGKQQVDAEKHNVWQTVEPSTWSHVNPDAPWYRAMDEEGKNFNHAWFITFAPAEKPQIAVAVFVEYGCAGGTSARIAGKVIAACMAHGYLLPSDKVATRD